MKVSAPTMMMTPTSIATKSGVCVGSVPAPVGTIFLAPSAPASASTGILMKKRPKNIARPSVVL